MSDLKERFERAREAYIDRTMIMSYHPVGIPEWAELINLGKDTLPFLIEKIRSKEPNWIDLMLLREFSGYKPDLEIPHWNRDYAGRIYKMVKVWEDWADRNGY